jgi:hypothetical protein
MKTQRAKKKHRGDDDRFIDSLAYAQSSRDGR